MVSIVMVSEDEPRTMTPMSSLVSARDDILSINNDRYSQPIICYDFFHAGQ